MALTFVLAFINGIVANILYDIVWALSLRLQVLPWMVKAEVSSIKYINQYCFRNALDAGFPVPP